VGIPRPDGTALVFDIIKVPLFNPDGSRKGLVVVGCDITARKQAEEAKLAAERAQIARDRAELDRAAAESKAKIEREELAARMIREEADRAAARERRAKRRGPNA